MRRQDPNQLTDRELEVLELIRRDFTNEQIADRLGISLDGAKYHVSQILSKLGVATREEAAAVALEEWRRWWAAWPLWAKIAGAATVVATVAGLAILIWGVLRTDGSTKETVPENGASLVETPNGRGRIGSYDDPNDFASFAARIDAAIRTVDVQFFLDNTRFEDFPCDRAGFPARPKTCGQAFNSAVIPAAHIMRFNSDDYGADRAEYEQLIQTFLSSSATSSDGYGDGHPHLYSYGIRTARFGGPSPGGDIVEALATAISDQFPGGTSPYSPHRWLVDFQTAYDGQRWLIDGITYGADPANLALHLDATGAGREVETGGPVWQFWQRWE